MNEKIFGKLWPACGLQSTMNQIVASVIFTCYIVSLVEQFSLEENCGRQSVTRWETGRPKSHDLAVAMMVYKQTNQNTTLIDMCTYDLV